MNAELEKALHLGPRMPPTEETLREAWKRWHFLGPDVDHKEQLLFTTTPYLWPREMVQAAALLKKRFGQMLDPETYETSVDLIEIWEGLQTSLKTSEELHAQLIESNLRWEHLDNLTAGRVAVVRSVRHFSVTREVDVKQTSPGPMAVQRWKELSDEYLAARQHATELLMEIAFPTKLRTRQIKTLRNSRSGQLIQVDATVEDHPRGVGVPRKVPWETEIAQLAALKRISDRALRQFMSERFLQLSYQKQKHFLKTFHSKPHRARNKCGTLAPWLADNAPLLRVLQRQWNDVQLLVHEFFPKEHSPSELRTFASKHDVKLGFRAGGNYVNHNGFSPDQIKLLLTPAVVLP